MTATTLGLGALTFAVAATAMPSTTAYAESITHIARPGQVPDQEPPRINEGDAPAGFGADSWQGPSVDKTNWHARYNADGDYLSTLFPNDAADLTVGDLDSISYHTKRPESITSGRDWWINVYTRPDGEDDAASWYGYRFVNNYDDHTETGAWTEYSTDGDMTFNQNDSTNPNGSELDFSTFKNDFGDEEVEMISVQTDSSWNGFDGYMDGLTIELTNGNTGQVNFEAVPLPGAGWAGLALLSSMGGVAGLRRRFGRDTA